MAGPSPPESRSRQEEREAGRGPDFRPFSKDLPPPLRKGGLRSRSFMERLVSRVPDSGNLPLFTGGIGRFPWLTLRGCLPINAPDRASLRRRGLSAISMVLSAATSCGRIADAVGTGECPEWQRELTVNQPPHGFAGSSPASPTTLRPEALR